MRYIAGFCLSERGMFYYFFNSRFDGLQNGDLETLGLPSFVGMASCFLFPEQNTREKAAKRWSLPVRDDPRHLKSLHVTKRKPLNVKLKAELELGPHRAVL